MTNRIDTENLGTPGAAKARSDGWPVGRAPIRVLHVLHTLARAGAEQLVYEMAVANKGRLAIGVVCLDAEGPLADALRSEGVPVFFTRRREGLDWRQVTRIAGAIRSFRPDIIHCHQYTPFFYGAMGGLFAQRGKVIFTEHGRHYPDLVSGKRRLVNRLLGRRACHITAVCQFTRQRLIALEGLPASRIEVVYNGVDAGRFEVADGKEIERRRVGLPLPVDRPIIVHVGTLRPVKDHGTAIRAFARVHAQQPEAVLAFVGGGPDLAKCQELVSRLGLADSTVFLGSRDDVPRVLAAADIMLMTSLSEGHSVALLEGMAAGLPVVATNVGGIPETVADGQTGLLAPVGDDAAVAAQLVRLLNDESLRQAMGRAGRERVRTLFTRQAMHRRYVEIYHGVVEGRARP